MLLSSYFCQSNNSYWFLIHMLPEQYWTFKSEFGNVDLLLSCSSSGYKNQTKRSSLFNTLLSCVGFTSFFQTSGCPFLFLFHDSFSRSKTNYILIWSCSQSLRLKQRQKASVLQIKCQLELLQHGLHFCDSQRNKNYRLEEQNQHKDLIWEGNKLSANIYSQSEISQCKNLALCFAKCILKAIC